MARACVTLGALLPYWRFLSFHVIYVTDDFFTSDIFNGEFPGRILIGQMIRHGEWPVWTNQLCSGIPLAGAPLDPIGLATFAFLPPAAALDLLVISLVLIAAHGAYGFARRIGADRPGSVLAGVAFAGSGYIAAQLKHLGIISTVVWLPVGLELVHRALARIATDETSDSARCFFIAAFGLVFAVQVLAGFPQSAYICALVYGAFALALVVPHLRRDFAKSVMWLAAFGAASLIAAAAGAVILLPLTELGATSDRSQALGWAWSTFWTYWPGNILTFLLPYINGDISNNTYLGPSLFWEDYGYVGAATFLLALYGGFRERHRPLVRFSAAMTIGAFLLVLGRRSPLFYLAYVLLPGMSTFRFPTRFLIVVELGLAVLAAVGLTRLENDLGRRFAPNARLSRTVVMALCLVTTFDLWFHQPRQNPVVSAQSWLQPPPSVDLVRVGRSQPRTFTPQHDELHRRVFVQAEGWKNVAPYFELRDVLQPNIGAGYWNTPSADCYAGISPGWNVDMWGDHNREGLAARLAHLNFDDRTLEVNPQLVNVLKSYGVTHLLSVFPASDPRLRKASGRGQAYVYPIDDAARVRVVYAARHVNSDDEAATRLLDAGFEPDREVLLHDVPSTVGPAVDEIAGGDRTAPPGHAVITRETSRDLVIDAEASQDGFLLVADTFYPGWIAQVDGKNVPIYRANLSVRAVQFPKGRHNVRFEYQAQSFYRGLLVTMLAVSALFLWLGTAAFFMLRKRDIDRLARTAMDQ